MITVLETAIDKIKNLPEDRQRVAAEILEQIAAGDGTYVLSEEEQRLVDEGLAELDRGEFASEAEVRAVFDKHRT